MKKPELLSPVGNFAMLEAAKQAGADSVYFGIKGLNMRNLGAKNFSLGDLRKIGKEEIKKYLTVNTIIYDNEIKKARKIIESAYSNNIDAVIVWDLAALKLAKEIGIEAHISTQASVANSEAIKQYQKLGAKRFVLARELDLKQLKELKKKTNAELEVFIHGAMCVAFSGRCFMSQEIFGKSANRGECLQPCRREYIIKDVDREYELKLGNNYVLSPKDLCSIPFIERLMFLDAFKIEGRGRSPEYVKVVTSAYRRAIDAYYSNELDDKLKKELMKEVSGVYNRGFHSGFYFKVPGGEGFAGSYGSQATKKKIYIGKIINYYKKNNVLVLKVEAEKIKVGNTLLIIGNKTGVKEIKVKEIMKNNQAISEAKKGDIITMRSEVVRENDQVYLWE
ncbi:MAG: U32 family peptidase [Candidatus Nanoarchaeia archaeon]|nr:U32 family peptidase [Candidatus Nanoarchaeia archaeon]